MRVTLVGVSQYEKEGKKSFTLHVNSPFSNYENEKGAIGAKAQTIWTNQIDCSMLIPGDVLDLSFEPGFQNQATLSNITIVQKAHASDAGKGTSEKK